VPSPNRKNFPLDLNSRLPAQLREATLQLFGLVKHFHDVELAAIVQLSSNDTRIVDGRVVGGRRRLLEQAVDEEHLSTRLERRLHRRPETVEAARGDV
jgi:hypothetical protein